MEQLFKIRNLVYEIRQNGNTTWILKAAIIQPECIIVSKNMEQAKFLEREYFYLLSKSVWYKKLYWKLFGRKNPKFMTIDSNFKGIRNPIIFDNGSLC